MKIRFTYTSLLTAIVVFSFIAVCTILYMKRKREAFSKFEVSCIFISLILLNIRLLLPFEFSCTHSFYIPKFYFLICGFIRKKVFHSISVFNVCMFVAGVGSVIVAIYKGILYWKFCGEMKNSIYLWTESVNEKKQVKVYKNKEVEEPFIYGIKNPKIILPEKITYNTSYIIKHEIQHYKKHDLWYKLFLEVMCILYWWNPFIYILKKYLHNMMELRNDFTVIRNATEDEKIDYATTLVEAAKFKKNLKYGLGINCNESFLKYRIHSLFEKKIMKQSLFIILLTGVTLFSSFCVFEPIGDGNTEENVFSITEDDMYLIYDTDGYHIISQGKEVGIVDEVPEDLAYLKIIYDGG